MQSLSAPHAADWGGSRRCAIDERAPKSLMVSFDVIVEEVLLQDVPEVVLTEGDDVIETLVLDGANHAFGIGVEIWAGARQPDELDTRGLESMREGSGVERVSVDDELGLLQEEAIDGIGEVLPQVLR